MTAAATKADSDSGDSDMPPGKKPCPTCKGSKKIKGGNMTCPACKGKGFMKPKAAAKMAAAAAVDVALKAGAITQEQADDILAQVNGEDVEKAKRPLPSSVEPVAAHREPDGTSTVEVLEPEAGLGTDPDPKADKVPRVRRRDGQEKPPTPSSGPTTRSAPPTRPRPSWTSTRPSGPSGMLLTTLGGWFGEQAAKAAADGDGPHRRTSPRS